MECSETMCTHGSTRRAAIEADGRGNSNGTLNVEICGDLMTESGNSIPGVQVQRIAQLLGNTEVFQLAHGLVGIALFGAFDNRRDRVNRSGGCVATEEKTKWEKEDGMVYPKTTSALGGAREVPNDTDR